MTYLSGPMTGIAEHNYPAFRAAAKELRGRGYRILSPHEEEPCTDHENPMPWSFYIRRDLLAMLLQCDSVAFLPGWETSAGAQLEYSVAKACGYLIYDVVEDRLVAR